MNGSRCWDAPLFLLDRGSGLTPLLCWDFFLFLNSWDLDLVRGIGVFPESEELTDDLESFSEFLLRLLPKESRALFARWGDCGQSMLGFLNHSLSSEVEPASKPAGKECVSVLNFAF